MTLPRASRTACDVKFSEGMRLMKCFCLFFSYVETSVVRIQLESHEGGVAMLIVMGKNVAAGTRWCSGSQFRTFSMISKTTGSACCKEADSSFVVAKVSKRQQYFRKIQQRRGIVARHTCCWPSKLVVEMYLPILLARGSPDEATPRGRQRSTRSAPRKTGRDMAAVSERS